MSLGPQKGLLLQMLERIPKDGSLQCSVECGTCSCVQPQCLDLEWEGFFLAQTKQV